MQSELLLCIWQVVSAQGIIRVVVMVVAAVTVVRMMTMVVTTTVMTRHIQTKDYYFHLGANWLFQGKSKTLASILFSCSVRTGSLQDVNAPN